MSPTVMVVFPTPELVPDMTRMHLHFGLGFVFVFVLVSLFCALDEDVILVMVQV